MNVGKLYIVCCVSIVAIILSTIVSRQRIVKPSFLLSIGIF